MVHFIYLGYIICYLLLHLPSSRSAPELCTDIPHQFVTHWGSLDDILGSDLIMVDDVAKLRKIKLGAHVLSALEYCHANFTNHFTDHF